MNIENAKRTFALSNSYWENRINIKETIRAIFPDAKKDGLIEKFAKKAEQFGEYIESHPKIKKMGIAMAAAVTFRVVLGADTAFADTGVDVIPDADVAFDVNDVPAEPVVEAPEVPAVEAPTPEAPAAEVSATDTTAQAEEALNENPEVTTFAETEVKTSAEEPTQIVDGNEIDSDEPVVVVDDNVADAVTMDATAIEPKTINVSELGDSKGYSIPEGQVADIVYSPIETDGQTEVMVLYGPDGKAYVAMAPEAGMSHDNKVKYFAELWQDKKIPYNPYDQNTWPTAWIESGDAPKIQWLTGVTNEGSVFETALGKISGSWDADGNLHIKTDGQALEVVNTSEGLTREEMINPDDIEVANKGQFGEPVTPTPDTPDVPQPTPDTPEVPKTPVPETPTYETIVSELGRTGADPNQIALMEGLAAVAGLTALGAGYAATLEKVTLDLDGNYGFVPYETEMTEEQGKTLTR